MIPLVTAVWIAAVGQSVVLLPRCHAQVQGASSAGALDVFSQVPQRMALTTQGDQLLNAAAGERVGTSNDWVFLPTSTNPAVVAYPAVGDFNILIQAGKLEGETLSGAAFTQMVPKFPVQKAAFTYNLNSQMSVSRANQKENRSTQSTGTTSWTSTFVPGFIQTRNVTLGATANVRLATPSSFPGTAAGQVADPWVFRPSTDMTLPNLTVDLRDVSLAITGTPTADSVGLADISVIGSLSSTDPTFTPIPIDYSKEITSGMFTLSSLELLDLNDVTLRGGYTYTLDVSSQTFADVMVPEPSSLILLGIGLVCAITGGAARRLLHSRKNNGLLTI